MSLRVCLQTVSAVGRAVAACVLIPACASASSATQEDPPVEARSFVAKPATARVDASTVEIGEQIPPDEAMTAMLAPLAEKVTARANRVIGELSTPLTKAERGVPESTLGNWASDALRRQVTRSTGRRIDVCFTNNGGLRRSLPAGPITEGIVVELMPFENGIVILDVAGARARTLLSQVVERGEPASGMTYVRDSQCRPLEILIADRPIDDNKTYSICTNDYLYEGGGNYGMDDIKNVTYTGMLIRDAFIAEFEEKNAAGESIRVKLDGRAVVRDAGEAS